jgi:hypothetical protein
VAAGLAAAATVGKLGGVGALGAGDVQAVATMPKARVMLGSKRMSGGSFSLLFS